MEITEETINEFARLLVIRGFGIYGDKKMMTICDDVGITCSSDGRLDELTVEDIETRLKELMVKYSEFNLPARLTTLVLAKKMGIPIPDELKTEPKRKSKYSQRKKKR